MHAHAENGLSSPHHDDRSPNRFSLFSLPPVEFAQHLTSHDAVSHDRLLKINYCFPDNSAELKQIDLMVIFAGSCMHSLGVTQIYGWHPFHSVPVQFYHQHARNGI